MPRQAMELKAVLAWEAANERLRHALSQSGAALDDRRARQEEAHVLVLRALHAIQAAYGIETRPRLEEARTTPEPEHTSVSTMAV
jgi:hypothetical protein